VHFSVNVDTETRLVAKFMQTSVYIFSISIGIGLFQFGIGTRLPRHKLVIMEIVCLASFIYQLLC